MNKKKPVKTPYQRTRPNVKPRLASAAALSVPDVVRATGFGQNAVRDLIHSGEVPSFRVGKKVYVLRAVLRDWLQARGNPAA